MALFLTFSSISSLSFQKKRRRKGVEEGEVFSLSFLSFSFLFHFFFKRKRTPFSLSLSPFGRRNIPALFPFFLLFQKEKEKEKRFLFHLFSLPFREEKSSSFFSSSEEEMRWEKWEKKEGEMRREREKIFALLGKFWLSYDTNYLRATQSFR